MLQEIKSSVARVKTDGSTRLDSGTISSCPLFSCSRAWAWLRNFLLHVLHFNMTCQFVLRMILTCGAFLCGRFACFVFSSMSSSEAELWFASFSSFLTSSVLDLQHFSILKRIFGTTSESLIRSLKQKWSRNLKNQTYSWLSELIIGSISTWWIAMPWTMLCPNSWKVRPHKGQVKGFSPLCDSWCFASSFVVWKISPQKTHSKSSIGIIFFELTSFICFREHISGEIS